MVKNWEPNQADRDEMADSLVKKAKWHLRNAGKGHASNESAAQNMYRAELTRSGIPHPDLPKVRHVGGRAVEAESKPRSGRPKPEDFAWR